MTEVWVTDTDEIGAIPLPLFRLLDPGERAKASSILSIQDRRLFIVGRILLRQALSVVLGGDPAVWSFTLGEHGKPCLAKQLRSSHEAPRVDFNISHSGSAVAVSVSISDFRDCQVGLDIELMDPTVFRGAEAPLDLFFTPEECDSLEKQSLDQRWEETLRLWTCKEAYAKFLGYGINLDFSKLKIPDANPDFAMETHELTLGKQKYHLALASRTDGVFRESPVHRESLSLGI